MDQMAKILGYTSSYETWYSLLSNTRKQQLGIQEIKALRGGSSATSFYDLSPQRYNTQRLTNVQGGRDRGCRIYDLADNSRQEHLRVISPVYNRLAVARLLPRGLVTPRFESPVGGGGTN